MRALVLKIDNVFGLRVLFFYGIVGTLSAIISFATFALLWDVFHIYYKVAVTISYISAVLFNFFSNRNVTFKSSGSNMVAHMYRYLTMILLNYAITMFIVHFTVKRFLLSPYVGLVVSMVVTAAFGFILSKFWVYNKN